MTVQDQVGAAPPAPMTAPAGVQVSRRRSRSLRAKLLWAVLLVAFVAAGVWGIPRHPWYQEWRLSRLSLVSLQKERGIRMDDPVLLYYTGLRLNQMGRYPEADPLLRQAVGIDPDAPRYRDEWARALLGSGLTTAAFGQLRQFAGTHPDLPEAHLILGKFYLTQRSMRRAQEELEKAVQLAPGSGEGWAYLAAAREALGELEKAFEAALKAVDLRPDNAKDRLLLASLLVRRNQVGEARKEYIKCVSLAPKWADAHREYALFLLNSHTGAEDAKLAEAGALRAVELDPGDPRAAFAAGRALRQNGKLQEAAPHLLRAATLAADDAAAAQELSQVYRALGRGADAQKWTKAHRARQAYASERMLLYEQLRVNPTSPELHRKLARILGLHGDVAGSVHNHAMALRCAVDAPRALIAAANDLTDGGYAREALPLAQRAVQVSKANPAAHEALGNALLGLGQVHLAGEQYNKTAGWWPHRTPVMRKRLERYYVERAKNPPPAELAYREARKREMQTVGPRRFTPEVEALAKRAVDLEPANPNYAWYLLRAQMAQRKNDEAIVTAQRLLALVPKDARAHALTAVLLLDKAVRPDELAKVEEHIKAAEAEQGVAATRHYAQGLLALRRQQPQVAVKELREAVRLDPAADVTYFKLASAEQMAGNPKAAARAMAEFRRRQGEKQAIANALGDIAQNPDRHPLYEKAARLFEAAGQVEEARAIRKEAERRFRKDMSKVTRRAGETDMKDATRQAASAQPALRR
jgi:tetratricopeptide (TPR) repeat protein